MTKRIDVLLVIAFAVALALGCLFLVVTGVMWERGSDAADLGFVVSLSQLFFAGLFWRELSKP